MKRDHNVRGGFAVATAMFTIAIVGVAMTAVCALLAADVRRTLNGSADAQLRQLLFAAEIDAPLHLSDATQQSWKTDLPQDLSAACDVETRRIPSTHGARLRVTAGLANRTLTEELRFDRVPDGWALRAAELFPPSRR